MDPRSIRYTQPTISNNFKNGGTVKQAINDIQRGRLSASDFPAIRVVEVGGENWTLDNRRLVAFQAAGLTNIPVQRVSMNDPLIAEEFYDKHNPIDQGTERAGKMIVIGENRDMANAITDDLHARRKVGRPSIRR